MIEHGVSLMVIGMGTVGAFLTTMVVTMSLSAAVVTRWFPEKSKSSAKKSASKGTGTNKAKKVTTAKSTSPKKA